MEGGFSAREVTDLLSTAHEVNQLQLGRVEGKMW